MVPHAYPRRMRPNAATRRGPETQAKWWTLAELHRLPDDGNKYELVRGDLFVAPAPSVVHETILVRLTDILAPFVAANDLGNVFHPRAVVRFKGSEVEPDLMCDGHIRTSTGTMRQRRAL